MTDSCRAAVYAAHVADCCYLVNVTANLRSRKTPRLNGHHCINTPKESETLWINSGAKDKSTDVFVQVY